MKKIIFLSLFLFSIQSIFAKNYYVSNSTGNDNNNGSINAPYKTLAKV